MTATFGIEVSKFIADIFFNIVRRFKFKYLFKASFIMVSLLYYQVQNADYDLVTCASIFIESRKSDCLDRTFSCFFTISTILGSGTILVKLMDMFPV
jgi:hypothetical protein